MYLRRNVIRTIAMGLIGSILSSSMAFALEKDASATDSNVPFVSKAESFSAAEATAYTESQSEAENNVAFSAVGMDDGGVTALEVFGIFFLVGAVGLAIAAAAAG